MKLIPFVVALCVMATYAKGAKNAETIDEKVVVDTEKELKLLHEETAKQKAENDDLRREMARQKEDADLRIQEEIAKARVNYDLEKIATDEQKVAMEREKSEIDAQNVKLIEMVKRKTVKQSKRQNFSPAEMTPLKTVGGEVKGDSMGSNQVSGFITKAGACSGHNGDMYLAPFPHLVWYEFPNMHIPAKVSFEKVDWDWGIKPKAWKFVGSPDENCDHNSNWTEFCGDSTGGNSCWVPLMYHRTAYKCLGIRILSNGTGKGLKIACFKNMKFWEFKIQNAKLCMIGRS